VRDREVVTPDRDAGGQRRVDRPWLELVAAAARQLEQRQQPLVVRPDVWGTKVNKWFWRRGSERGEFPGYRKEMERRPV